MAYKRMVIEGECHCEPQTVTEDCSSCWDFIRQNNTLFSWAYFEHDGRTVCAMNLGRMWDALLHRQWGGVRNMLVVLVQERPYLGWRRDWSSWMDA